MEYLLTDNTWQRIIVVTNIQKNKQRLHKIYKTYTKRKRKDKE